MTLKYELTRDVMKSECEWLDEDLFDGMFVYLFEGATYGCVSQNGLPFTMNAAGQGPFFELPKDAVVLRDE